VRWWCVTSALLALASCTSTVDSVGYNGVGGAVGIRLQKVHGPTTYPNPFRDVMKTDAEVADKIARTWNQLFYGDPGNQAIYVPVGADQAYIQDTLHLDKRTEGIGLAMMIAVQLDKRTEFDRLWRYAEAEMKQKDGPRRGYFASRCDTAAMTTVECDDPYGEAQILTALIFAHDRWLSTTTVDYEAAAVDLLTVMRHKEEENRGVVEGVTNTFDRVRALPFDLPERAKSDMSRPSIVMPAYYDLWAEATGGDPFWTRAARAARDYWKKTAHPDTGLTPVRASLEGKPVLLYDNFRSEAYRAQINMALDWAWAKGEKDEWLVTEADKLLAFFTMKGMGTYAGGYNLDGTEVIDPMRDLALVVANGVTGMVASKAGKDAYINTVFDMATPTGPARYYAGILDLTALLILSGQYIVW